MHIELLSVLVEQCSVFSFREALYLFKMLDDMKYPVPVSCPFIPDGTTNYSCGGLNNNGPQVFTYLNASHQDVALFERIRRVRNCGLIGESRSLGLAFKVSKVQAKPRVFLLL